MKYSYLILLAILFTSTVSFAEEAKEGYVQITVKNNSVFPNLIQIRDDVCTLFKNEECEEAELELKNKECRKGSNERECKEAKEMIKSSICIAGLVYEGMLDDGESVQVSVCKSSAGFGNVSLRAVKKSSIWFMHRLMSDGDTVTYP